MSIRKFIEAQPILELTSYNEKGERTKDSVSFSGSPRKHPYDSEKILLIIDPSGESTYFVEFLISDIRYFERLPNIVTDNGNIIPMARIWLPKGCIGIEYRPFQVDDPPQHFSSFEGMHKAVGACEDEQ